VPSRPPIEALRGSLDLLVLKTLSLAPTHGWGISQRIQQISGGELTMNQGSLYPALQRLENLCQSARSTSMKWLDSLTPHT
jgi:PadR family transcriptional regulator, regulatory protein PadR